MFRVLDEHDPTQAGPYSLRARIGSGGMGRVYLAYTPGGRSLAVKIVRPELAEDREFRRRFSQEVVAARRVHGAFTAELVDADADGDPPWLATVYVPGMSLHQAVVEHGPLPACTVWRLLAGVAEALQVIHAAGVIHRDLKPANVLLAADGPRVIDFGIARAADTTPMTRTGIRVGSPQFMAPEQARGEELTAAADVFACGALAVFAATGQSPFGTGPDAAVLYRVVNEPPQVDGVDDQRLRELAARCLRGNPEDRPSPAEIIDECAAANDVTHRKIGDGWLPEPMAGAASPRCLPGQATGGEASAATGGPDVRGQGRRPKRSKGTSGRGTMARFRPPLAMPILVVALMVAALIIGGSLTNGSSQSGGDAPGTVPSTTPPAVSFDPSSPRASTDPTPSSVPTTDPTTHRQQSTAPGRATTTAGNAAGTAPAVGVSAVTPALLGAPDFNGYCEATGQGSVQLASDNAYGWHCSNDNGTGDDANAVCSWTFGTDQITNRVADFNDPNSWQCWRANRELGSVNFTAYCQAIGYPGAYYVDGDYAYGWFCTNDQNGIDLQDACQRLYGSSPPISRFQDFYDQNSWQCWG